MTVTDDHGNTYRHDPDGSYRTTTITAGLVTVCVEGEGLKTASFRVGSGATLVGTTGDVIHCPVLVEAGQEIEVWAVVS